MRKPRTISQVVHDYIFTLSPAPKDTVLVTYPDGHVVDLGLIKPIQIGILQEDDEGENKWVVSLVTKEAINRLQMNITEKIELVGLRFDDFNDALMAHELLCKWVLKKDFTPAREIIKIDAPSTDVDKIKAFERAFDD